MEVDMTIRENDKGEIEIKLKGFEHHYVVVGVTNEDRSYLAYFERGAMIPIALYDGEPMKAYPSAVKKILSDLIIVGG